MNISIIDLNLSEYVDNLLEVHSEISLYSRIKWNTEEDVKQLYPLIGGEQDVVIVVVQENRFLAQILEYLHDLSIEDVFVVRLFAIDQKKDFLACFYIDVGNSSIVYDKKLVDRISTSDEKPYLVHLETHVCDHCNLNCKACNNFSPYVKEPTYADPIQFEKDINHLAGLFSGIGRFFLLGGEPLLAPELCCEMIRIYRKYFPDNELRVLTNATRILAMEDWFWDCLRDNSVIIHISLYPPVMGSIESIEDRLVKKGIPYIIFRQVVRFSKRLTEYPFEDPYVNNLRCGSSGCHYLRNGVITKCPDAWLSGLLPDKLGEKYRSKDVLNLYENSAWDIIRKTNAPIDLCSYCACSHMDMISWEPAGENPRPQDWLARHRFEWENDRLKKDLDVTKEDLNETKKELQVFRNNLNTITDELSETKEKLKITVAEKEIITKQSKIIREELTDKNKNLTRELLEVQAECNRIETSYSYRLGREITCLPRAVRRFWHSASENGLGNAIKGSFKKTD